MKIEAKTTGDASSPVEDPTVVNPANSQPITVSHTGVYRRETEPTAPLAIKGYDIFREIGAGTMGTVFEAKQHSTGRKVALKVLKGGNNVPERFRRFVLEAQVLSQLHHPGIARLFDSGVYATGDGSQPYFAMEFIQGKMLNKYINERGMDVRQRLELLIRICNAVHYAHLRGVIHRDLKPGNILVNEENQPKILDFGLARVTNSDIEAVTMHTAVGQILGSLNYMSPEQAVGIPERVDFRCDIYALGVMAFSMLCGKLPLNLRGQPLYLAVKTIRETPPEKLGDVDPRLKGPLEEIVARSLHKDKEKRHPSASDLAFDFQQYLEAQ